MSRNVQVITGAKGPNSFPDDPALIERAAAAGDQDAVARMQSTMGMLNRADSKVRPEDEAFVVFGSRYRGLTVQITAPEDSFNHMTGVRTRARPVKLKFKDFLCRVRRSDENLPLIMARVKEAPGFGLKLDFWLEKDFAANQSAARYSSVLNAIRQNPEIMERLTVDLQAAKGGDFKLPVPVVEPSAVEAFAKAPPAPEGDPAAARKAKRAERAKVEIEDMSLDELEAATAPV